MLSCGRRTRVKGARPVRGREGRREIVLGAVMFTGSALLVAIEAQPLRVTASSAVRETPTDLAIASPRPMFMQLSGQGPALSGHRVVWTATDSQGQPGSEADLMYEYDLAKRLLTVPVRSHFGSVGFVGSYALVGDELAYVDTGFAEGGVIPWRLSLLNLRTGRGETIATSRNGAVSGIPPQISFDGTDLLMLQTVDLANGHHDSLAILFTFASQMRRHVLQRVHDGLLGDPALGHNTALWTTIDFAPRASSHLTAYDLKQGSIRTISVGDVSQLSASGDYVVWKSGMTGTNGEIGLYSLARNRVVSTDLARSDNAIFPSIDGRLVAWTYGDGSRVQVYSLSSNRVIYNAPSARHRIYGLTSVSNHAVSWAYTVLATNRQGQARGYVVVHQVR